MLLRKDKLSPKGEFGGGAFADDEGAFDDGLVERLGDVGAYVSAAPAPVREGAFRGEVASDLSLTDRLAAAEAERDRLGLPNPVI